MAVFVSASDESDGGHHRSKFWHGGWVMPEQDWSRFFVPAWKEGVLDLEPNIPYLHMTDIRKQDWLHEHGLSWDQAQERMDNATLVIDQMGAMYPIVVNADAGAFLDAHGKKKLIESEIGKPARFLIDHFSFNAYVLTVLMYIAHGFPDAEKVDFVVERKEGVFEKLKVFYDTFEEGLKYIGRPDLVKYLGELIPAGKDRIPIQAADMLCWHASRADLGLLRGRDARRGITLFLKRGNIIPLADSIHSDLAKVFAEKIAERDNERKHGIQQIRRNNEATRSSSSRKDKSSTGRGKGRKTKEKAKD